MKTQLKYRDDLRAGFQKSLRHDLTVTGIRNKEEVNGTVEKFPENRYGRLQTRKKVETFQQCP